MFANIFGKNSKEKIIHFSLKNSNLTLNNRLNYNNCNIFTEKEKIFKYFKNYQYNYWNNPIKNRIKTNHSISTITSTKQQLLKDIFIHTKQSIKHIIHFLEPYASLGKIKLSCLVIVSVGSGIVMAPLSASFLNIFYTITGTSLAVISANTFNQVIEVEKDAKMKRTKKRMLPSGKLTRKHAFIFGFLAGITGSGILAYKVNLLASTLAFSNILLYACIYTPMKTIHPINTWIGSIVGAIPPMIGWASVMGNLGSGAWALALLLYVWQIPHFLTLAWRLRNDYQIAGYKMLSSNPDQLRLQSFIWTSFLIPVCIFCSWTEITTWPFIFDSMILNYYVIHSAYNFYKYKESVYAWSLFWNLTIFYLPLLLLLMWFHKKKKKDENN